MHYTALFFANLKISILSVYGNKLRTTNTMLIIAIGIMSLVDILTTVESIKKSVVDQFLFPGAGSFSSGSRGVDIQIGGNRIRTRINKKGHPFGCPF